MATLPTFVAGQILTAADLNAAFAATRTEGAWSTWTPTFTSGFTVGNASVFCSYFQSGNFVAAKMYIALGTTSVMGTLPVFNLPVPAQAVNFGGGQLLTFRDVSAGVDYDGFIRIAGSAQGYLLAKNSAGANDARTSITATVPFTWANGDVISGYLMYEAA